MNKTEILVNKPVLLRNLNTRIKENINVLVLV